MSKITDNKPGNPIAEQVPVYQTFGLTHCKKSDENLGKIFIFFILTQNNKISAITK